MSSPYLAYRRQLKNGEIPPPSKKPRKKIKPFSDKRAKLNRQYAKESKQFWEGKDCAIKAPGCQKKATGIHHVWGKDTAEKLMDEKGWLPACSYCNLIWVEQNDAKARELGLKKSRMKTKRFNK